MTVELKVPSAGESVAGVEIGEWRKAEGDAVKRDETIVLLQTDKASMEVPAPADGVLARILKAEGEGVEVGEVIAEIEPDGNGAIAKEPRAETEESSEEQPEQEEELAREPEAREEEPQRGAGRPERAEATEVEEEPRAEEAAEASTEEQTEPTEEQAEEELEQQPAEEEPEKEADEEEPPPPPRARPPQRRAQKARDDGQAAPRAKAPETRPARFRRDEDAEIVPMSLLRLGIARRLVQAQHEAALLTTFNEIDMSEVLALRRTFGEAFEKRHGTKLGIMSFFVKAVIEALKEFPELNTEIRGTEVVYHRRFDIGIAVGSERGLVVPVLRGADRMSLAEIESAIDDFAERAEAGALELAELQDGTFTITNGGVFGSLLSTPIVNPPQSGVLGMHAIQERPVARDGQVEVRPMMYVALTYDHRIADGREAVRFLRRVKELVEAPQRLLLET